MTGFLLLCLFGFDIGDRAIPNDGPKCTVSCLETAATSLGIKELKGLRDRTSLVGLTANMEKVLKQEGVDHLIQWDWVKDTTILSDYAETNGVTVTILENADWLKEKQPHSILVTNFSDKNVEYYDPNRPRTLHYVDTKKFLAKWSGSAIVLFPKVVPVVVQPRTPAKYIDIDLIPGLFGDR